MTILDRVRSLEKGKVLVRDAIISAAREATVAAVEVARNGTPPNSDDRIRGTNMITGNMAQSWVDDSRTEPTVTGDTIITELNNNMPYASYVNSGHRLTRHFVPGLYISEDGLLSYDLTKDVGMMVGTKTSFVPGLFMEDLAIDEYHRVLSSELEKIGGIIDGGAIVE